MSILDWIVATIVGIFVLILFLFLMGMALYSLFKIMGGIYEIFYDRPESEE